MTDSLRTDRETLLAVGMAHHQAGRLGEAEAVYRRVIVGDPDHAAALNNFGVLLAETDRSEEAIEMFNRAIAIEPGYVSAYANKAGALWSIGDLPSALEAFRQTTVLDPGHYEAHRALGFLWMEEGRRDRALDHFARTLELRRGDDRTGRASRSLTHATRAKLRHDSEQLRYLAQGHWDSARFEALARTLDGVAGDIDETQADNTVVALTADQLARLGDSYNAPYHLRDAPEVFSGAVNSDLDLVGIAKRYIDAEPGLVWFDDFLGPRALTILQRFLLESTIWYDFSHIGGCLAAYLEDGLACPLILQIADELRQAFPDIFADHPLTQIWAFKAIEPQRGIDLHADDGTLSVNFWVTPEDANTDPDHGGLVIYDKQPPSNWQIKDYTADGPAIREFLGDRAEKTIVPYRENRAVLFDSRLFHGSDAVNFAAGYENHRINITMLFGQGPMSSTG
jgi:tetratricopeptide (TPR) repeat protein